MPYTLSHPLAVVPLQRWCPAYLNFPALVIGSMTPDFGYFVGQFNVAGLAHTIPGSFVVCVPVGLLVLGLFYALRRPVCYLLPQPHRAALMPLATNDHGFSLRNDRRARFAPLRSVDPHRLGFLHASLRLARTAL